MPPSDPTPRPAGRPPGAAGPTRDALHRVATHVLARARAAHDGRFGLRVTPGGIGTPAFGPDATVLRLAGTVLVLEDRPGAGGGTEALELTGRSLGDAAVFAGVDLAAPFAPGADAPPVGDAAAALALDPPTARALLDGYRLGAAVLDRLVPGLRTPSVAQLWPEHFDLALDADTPAGRVTLGVSPGDGGHPAPYLYVSPWEPARPGDPAYWNARFGALAAWSEVLTTGDPVATGGAFFRRGLDLLAGS